jgi:hypothetical protein
MPTESNIEGPVPTKETKVKPWTLVEDLPLVRKSATHIISQTY